MPERPRADVCCVSGSNPSSGADASAQHNGRQPRPWIGVRFTCAGAYVRVYRAPNAPCYVARCPKCAMACRFAVGSGGTSQRLFDASCR